MKRPFGLLLIALVIVLLVTGYLFFIFVQPAASRSPALGVTSTGQDATTAALAAKQDRTQQDRPGASAIDRRSMGTSSTTASSLLVVRVGTQRAGRPRPLAGLRVEILPLRDDAVGARQVPSFPAAPSVDHASLPPLRTKPSDENGRAEFQVRPGSWLVRANAQQHELPQMSAAARVVEVEPGRQEIKLELASSTAALILDLREAGNRPIVGAQVLLRSTASAVGSWDALRNSSPFAAVQQSCKRRLRPSYPLAQSQSCVSCHSSSPADQQSEQSLTRSLPSDCMASGRSNAAGSIRFMNLAAASYRVEVLPVDAAQEMAESAQGRAAALWLPRAHRRSFQLAPGEIERAQLRLLRRASWSIRLSAHEEVHGIRLHFTAVRASAEQRARLQAWSGIEAARLDRMLASRRSFETRTSLVLAGGGQSRSGNKLSQLLRSAAFQISCPPGAWRLHYENPASSPLLLPAPMTLLVGPQKIRDQQLELQPGRFTASGRFLDKKSRQGIAKLLVIARDPGGNLIKRCLTKSDGSYAIHGLRSGPFVLCWHRNESLSSDIPLQRKTLDKQCRRFAGPLTGQTQLF